ncbi:putative decarboxylase [Mycobacterium lentiflavum]|uniref:Putative decarboxylase n=1 Tax=Mycobacterium lentiflavum TaxID=141349 RepID=A0A0E4H4Z1_MYCLN|nr:pyridoxal-dependent decarboxylase [Mycobacterium lentiflavum]CQD22310.1 putative decarboxylase [Mycobacterium lentiflavum]
MSGDTAFESEFLTVAGAQHYLEAVNEAAGHVAAGCLRPARPGFIQGAAALRETLAGFRVVPRTGLGLSAVLDETAALVAPHSTAVSNPNYVAHLHCPPAIASLAAETMLCALNQSMDSFDQGPAAAVVEQFVIDWLCEVFDLADGDGVFTSGGTQSNLQALMLARDNFAARTLGVDIAADGLPPDARRWRIVCTDDAHFSVLTAARLLGLGEAAILPAGTDACGRLDAGSLRELLHASRLRDEQVIAVVLSAGTTNRGAIDPLANVIEIAAGQDIWVHVDAAAAGCLMLSERHRNLLDGISAANSISVDFHKLLFQTISCAALLVRQRHDLDVMRSHSDYLNPADDDEVDILNHVGKSLQTTRRFDALKVLITLRSLGLDTVAKMIDRTVEAARAAGDAVAAQLHLDLISPCTTNTVILRWTGPDTSAVERDHVNIAIRQHLVDTDQALIGRTRIAGATALKLTFVNPVCTPDRARDLVQRIADCGNTIATAGATQLNRV